MTCPKCGSENVLVTREQGGSVGGAIHTVSTGHGCMWWLTIGWWKWIFDLILWPFKALFNLFTLGLFRRKKGHAYTVNANKTVNHTVAVCQNCGHTWRP